MQSWECEVFLINGTSSLATKDIISQSGTEYKVGDSILYIL